jgi:hypothetical protein
MIDSLPDGRKVSGKMTSMLTIGLQDIDNMQKNPFRELDRDDPESLERKNRY